MLLFSHAYCFNAVAWCPAWGVGSALLDGLGGNDGIKGPEGSDVLAGAGIADGGADSDRLQGGTDMLARLRRLMLALALRKHAMAWAYYLIDRVWR